MNKLIIGILFCLSTVFSNGTFAQKSDSPFEIIFSPEYYQERMEELENEYKSLWKDFKSEIRTLYGFEAENPVSSETTNEPTKTTAVKEEAVEIQVKKQATYNLPLHESCTITSGFGYRKHPVYKKRMFHNGIDIACKLNTNVYAAEKGTVVFAGMKKNFGFYVKIQHPDNSTTAYAHLNRVVVKKGQKVAKNEMIAYSGNTGVSTGPHLHFEMEQDGEYVNPLSFLNAVKQ